MKQVELQLDDFLYQFYSKLGQTVGKSPETVMTDALFRLAGEGAMQSIQQKSKRKR